ncbi:MAG: hypothetical protein DI537_10260 [Stutzerimonas stutzeri]|nr:MAG: hypothetical protein DI537_10260 [Stutzerimonas stutzeri]
MTDVISFSFSDGTTIELEPQVPIPRPVDEPTSADCSTCGACCAEAGFVSVRSGEPTPHTLTRSTRGLGLSAETLASLGSRCMKRHMGGRCVALTGVIGKSVSCSIYSDRPAVCRQFEAGSPGCLSAREAMRYKMASGGGWRGYGDNWKATIG